MKMDYLDQGSEEKISIETIEKRRIKNTGKKRTDAQRKMNERCTKEQNSSCLYR